MDNIIIVLAVLAVIAALIPKQIHNQHKRSARAKRFQVYRYMHAYMKGLEYANYTGIIGLCSALRSYRNNVDDSVSQSIEDYPELLSERDAMQYKQHKPFWWNYNDINIRIQTLERVLKGE